MDSIPNHIVFIPDGNRRWAKKNNKQVLEGHIEGVKTQKKVLEWCNSLGVKTVTFWAFSTENFKRDREEVDGLMKMLEKQLVELKDMKELHENKIRVRFFGRLWMLTEPVRAKFKEIEDQTKDYTNYNLNFLFAYGGRQELVDACNAAIADAKNGKIEKVDENTFGDYMYMKDAPDLIFRSSGEMRLSGILPWQSGYSELYFCEKLWPEIEKKDLEIALEDFARRKRRFGK